MMWRSEASLPRPAPPSEPEPDLRTEGLRSLAFRVLILLAFGALTLQLWRLQIVDSRTHRAAAEGNRLRLVDLPPLRALIYDRSFNALALNSPAFTVSVVEADVPRDRRAQVLGETGRLLGISLEEIEQTLRTKAQNAPPFTPITIRENVPRDVALRLEERSWALPGVAVRVATLREYVDSPLFSHIIGYLALPTGEEYARRYRKEGYGIDERVGAAGVELTYESELRGRPGIRLLEVDAAGRPLKEIHEQPPEPGRGLVLTIDQELQWMVRSILDRKLPANPSAVGILMDPRNGEVLALVSTPSYDANTFSLPQQDAEIGALLSDPGLPLFNRAIAGQYAPGSTFKLVTGIGALEEGLVSRNTRIDCNGGLRIPNPYNPRASTLLPDHGVFGRIDFVQGLAVSCNVYFYTLGGGYGDIEGLGNLRLGRYARGLGYGEPTGIDLPSEAPGQIPWAEWKVAHFGEPWFPGDTYNMAIGQGFVLATPIQVATVTNAIATGGTAYRPRVVRSIVDSEGRKVRDLPAELARRIGLRPDTLAAMRDGMVAVLDTPQTRAHQLAGIRVAGKTGTAEFGAQDARGARPTHGWFTAFAPAESPRVSVTVFLERGSGPNDALPLAMEILREYFARNPR